MTRSLAAHGRVRLEQVGLFADGAAVKEVGGECFRIAEQYVDDALGFEGLDDEGELEALLTDPRTGVRLPTYRKAANG